MVNPFLRHADNIASSRSSVITPLMWTLGTVAAITVALVVARAPTWMLTASMILVLIAFLAILVAYAYFAVKKPSYLRSERFGLIESAINKDLQGDSLANLKNVIDVIEPQPQVLEGPDVKKLGPGNE